MSEQRLDKHILSEVADYYQHSDNELGRRYLREKHEELDAAYLNAALAHRYSLYPNIERVADFDGANGLDVLEVGVGQGLDHIKFALAGANLKGVDLTLKHCQMTSHFMRMINKQPFITRADATSLPFPDDSFDQVYSCGVLMLIPNIQDAFAEIKRVLKPGGHATIMLYNRSSIHYWIKTRLFYGWALGEDRILGKDVVNDWYTDGPGYLHLDYYSPSDLPKLFHSWSRIEYQVDCMGDEQIPFFGVPKSSRVSSWLEHKFGFFLWVRAYK